MELSASPQQHQKEYSVIRFTSESMDVKKYKNNRIMEKGNRVSGNSAGFVRCFSYSS